MFGGKFVVSDLLDRIGAGTGAVAHGQRARMFSTRRGFDDGERERVSAAIDAIYDDFVAKVAEGRHRTVDQIHAIARGRVWTGADALANGLVDELGGLRDAVRIARERAGLPDTAPVRHAVHVPLLRAVRPAPQQRRPACAGSCSDAAGPVDRSRVAGRRVGAHAVLPRALIDQPAVADIIDPL